MAGARETVVVSQSTHVLPLEFNRRYPVIVKGDGVWVEDASGKRYLDAMSGGSMAATKTVASCRPAYAACVPPSPIPPFYQRAFVIRRGVVYADPPVPCDDPRVCLGRLVGGPGRRLRRRGQENRRGNAVVFVVRGRDGHAAVRDQSRDSPIGFHAKTPEWGREVVTST